MNSNEPTTTEIYSDEAFFDSTKNMGIFSGRVKVTDPRFNLQSDKLTVFITKGENQSLGESDRRRQTSASFATGPTRTAARQRAQLGAQTRRLTRPRLGTWNCEGTPRVQEGPNMHVATSPDTVMIINQNSQLRTHGPKSDRNSSGNEGRSGKGKRNREAKKAEAQAAPSQSVPAAALPTP